jgi:hypothetical protein
MKIKNISPLKTALNVAGYGRVDFGQTLDVPKDIAEALAAGKLFKLADGKPNTPKAAAKNAGN